MFAYTIEDTNVGTLFLLNTAITFLTLANSHMSYDLIRSYKNRQNRSQIRHIRCEQSSSVVHCLVRRFGCCVHLSNETVLKLVKYTASQHLHQLLPLLKLFLNLDLKLFCLLRLSLNTDPISRQHL